MFYKISDRILKQYEENFQRTYISLKKLKTQSWNIQNERSTKF